MPKSLHSDNEREFYKGLSRTPVNDSLVLDFVKHLIEEKQLGKMDVPDYLSVSFSSTDYVGHTWGVASLEAEDNLLRVDKNLEELINFLDTRIGLTKVLIVLSADHGAGEISEQMVARGFQSKRIPPDEFRDYLNKELRTKFSASKDLVKDVLYPYVFFDLECLKAEKLDLRTVENVCAEVAMQYSGITFAVGRTAIMAGALPSDQGFYAQIKNNFHPKRAGHVHVVTDPYVMFGEKVTTEPGDHGSVWTYDTYVPIMFAGPNIRSGRYSRSVSPHDVAATISNFLGIKPPSGSIGTPLSEVLQ